MGGSESEGSAAGSAAVCAGRWVGSPGTKCTVARGEALGHSFFSCPFTHAQAGWLAGFGSWSICFSWEEVGPLESSKEIQAGRSYIWVFLPFRAYSYIYPRARIVIFETQPNPSSVKIWSRGFFELERFVFLGSWTYVCMYVSIYLPVTPYL